MALLEGVREGRIRVSPLKKLRKWSIRCILGNFFSKTKVADRYSADKIGDEGL